MSQSLEQGKRKLTAKGRHHRRRTGERCASPSAFFLCWWAASVPMYGLLPTLLMPS